MDDKTFKDRANAILSEVKLLDAGVEKTLREYVDAQIEHKSTKSNGERLRLIRESLPKVYECSESLNSLIIRVLVLSSAYQRAGS